MKMELRKGKRDQRESEIDVKVRKEDTTYI